MTMLKVQARPLQVYHWYSKYLDRHHDFLWTTDRLHVNLLVTV